MNDIRQWVVDLTDPAAAELAVAGGKAVGLHALLGAGLPVPGGFCVTTTAFMQACTGDPALAGALAELDACAADDLPAIRGLAARLRAMVVELPLPDGIAAAVGAAFRATGEAHAYAVRSSASAEDLEDASFAGLQDTYLHVRGEAGVIDRVRACWASLFTDRAVVYRRHHAIPGAQAAMAVVVQRMIDAEAAGVIFSADPTTGHRGVAVIEAVWGLGESLVSGRALADVVRVRRQDGAILERRIADKRREIVGVVGGGTVEQDVPEDRRGAAILDDAEVRVLCELAGRAEVLRGMPQDLEWARADGQLWLLQSRAITTLFPRPEVHDGRRHVFMSFGHIQVNTAALTPFGISVLQLVIPFMREGGVSRMTWPAGGRMYVDLTPALQRAPLRWILPAALSIMHRPSAERLRILMARPDVIAAARATRPSMIAVVGFVAPIFARAVRRFAMNPARMRTMLVAYFESMVARQVARAAAARDTAARLRVLQDELADEFLDICTRGAAPLIFAVAVGDRVLRCMCARLVPDAAPDALVRGLEGNVTTEMDLELGDLADHCRDMPELAAAIRGEEPAGAVARLRGRPGAAGFFVAWDHFLARHGGRCAGEIDAGTPRWRDRPEMLLRALAGLLDRPPGAHRVQHEAMRREAERVGAAMEAAASRGLFGWLWAPVVRGIIRRVRTAQALREHHKFALIELFALVHGAGLEVGTMLVADGAATTVDDVFLLTLGEVIAAADAHARGESLAGLGGLIEQRRVTQARDALRTPPSIMTDEGETPPLPAPAAAPPGTLVGVGVSSGVIEGRARVIRDPGSETLAAGEILVAPFTDPGWTPLFMHASALVMEVGGLMTHGSVVAREMGIPAVVAIEGVTRTIVSGRRIRVDGDRGWVTILEDDSEAQ